MVPRPRTAPFSTANSFDFAIDNPGSYSNEIWTGSLTAEWDFGPGTLTNVFRLRQYDATPTAISTRPPLVLFHSTTETAQEQFSNELRYAMSFDRLDLTVWAVSGSIRIWPIPKCATCLRRPR